jgi:hypothetical protein
LAITPVAQAEFKAKIGANSQQNEEEIHAFTVL